MRNLSPKAKQLEAELEKWFAYKKKCIVAGGCALGFFGGRPFSGGGGPFDRRVAVCAMGSFCPAGVFSSRGAAPWVYFPYMGYWDDRLFWVGRRLLEIHQTWSKVLLFF